MKTRLFSGILLSALSFSSLGQSVFYPENGDYRYSFADVTAALKSSHGAYLTLNPKLALNGASYKLVAKRNDFQARDYFKYDWFKLQDIFSFNPESFTRSFKRSTFNDAKRAQFATFELNGKKWFHHKTVPSMRE